ncbi:MAG TPA: RNA polymerase sporulation sigma factor SigK [Firmicutes bacterium]|nr:RNA polymerase sporulation sigma factor SigK [Bacillota bacterium]
MLEMLCSLLCRLFFFTGAVRDEGSYPKPLSKEEEQRCLSLARAGDKNARDKLVRHNMRLVAHVVKKYTGAAETDDMISVGSIGLIKAINTYEPSRGTRLATYTARCIENEILMFIRAGKKHKSTLSLSDPVGTDKDGNELTLMDLLFEKEDKVFGSVEQSLMQEKFLAAVKKLLSERETTVICLRYALAGGVPLPQREVARRLKISRSYVSRIEKRALEKLRDGLNREDFLAD